LKENQAELSKIRKKIQEEIIGRNRKNLLTEYREEKTSLESCICVLESDIESDIKAIKNSIQGTEDSMKTLGKYIDSEVDALVSSRKKLEDLQRGRGSLLDIKVISNFFCHFFRTNSNPFLQRVESLDYRLDTPYMVTINNDLERFLDAIARLFQWHGSAHKEYLAPYFPLIQSSGMGKSKLIREAETYFNGLEDTVAIHFVCVEEKNLSADSRMVFFPHLKDSSDKSLDEMRSKLNDYVSVKGKSKFVLFFDEAQGLTGNEGLAFRAIRWWLRAVRDVRVVAVFAGTTSKIVNFTEAPKFLNSRDGQGSYYNINMENLKFYEPFYCFHTMGLYARGIRDDVDTLDENTLLRNSKLYGRPLFAVMDDPFTADKQEAIMTRMIASDSTCLSDTAAVSILGTRFQIGCSSFSITSDLIAKKYAVLVDYSAKANYLRVTFPPDPVCASLAAQVMNQPFTLGRTTVRMGKKDWVRRFKELLEASLATVDRGDLGEIASAMYCLFCGDDVRTHEGSVFSYSFVSWAKSLLSIPENESDAYPVLGPRSSYCLSAIQMCRYFESISLEECWSRSFLKGCYAARVGMYFPLNNSTFDLLLPIRVAGEKGGGGISYIPLLISVKTISEISPGVVNTYLEAMKAAVDDHTPVIGLLFWLGLKEEEMMKVRNDKSRGYKGLQLSTKDIDEFAEKKRTSLFKAVLFPLKDLYGIAELVATTSVMNRAAKESASTCFKYIQQNDQGDIQA
jgi:hypothetical protein